MPDPALPAALPASAPTSPLRVVNGRDVRKCRYQVCEVLWGNRKRFVVQDTATHTTVAIRTTRQIADSDLIRLNLAATDRPDQRTALLPALKERSAEQIPDNALRRQCGRCRQLFASDPTLNPAVIQDWWVCESCHDKLMGTSPAPTSGGGVGSKAQSAPLSPASTSSSPAPAVTGRGKVR